MTQIALTTIFTPPASCFDNSYTLYGSPVYVKDVQVQSPECYPEGFRALWSVGEPFSPGVCPESYVGASSTENERDVTRVLCCPWSMTAHNGELGCFTGVHAETVLALPTGVVTVKGAMLAMHGILVAWASSDLTVLPAMPGSSPTTHPTETSSNEQQEFSTIPFAYASLTSSATPTSTLTITPLTTITESTTEKAELQMSDHAGGATQDTLTPKASSSPPSPSVTSVAPSASAFVTTHPSQRLPPAAIAGISIGAAAGAAILAGLAASVILFRRRRRRGKMHKHGVDVRVFDSASEFHEDKRRWSELSSSFGTVSGSGSEQTDTEASQADSRAVVPTISELEGN